MTQAREGILIVEDDESTVELERRTLERSGHRVHAVGLVQEALDALRRQAFQAVLLDYRLADGEAWPVFEAAQQMAPPIPVIFVTGMGDERIAAELIHRGVADYLIKGPGFWDRLPAAIERVLRLDRAERNNARLAAIVEASDEAIGSIDLDGFVLSWNGGAEGLYGYSREEMEGRPVGILIPPGLSREDAEVVERVHRGEVIRNFETTRRRKDGSLVDVSTTLSPIRDPAGNVIGTTFVTRDITDRKAAEKALQESEQQHRALFDASPLPMWVYDRDSLLLLAVNDAAVIQYGYSRDELLSMTLEDIRPPEDVPKLRAHHQEEAPQYHSAGIWRHVRKDGTVIEVDVHVTDVAIGGRLQRLALLHDVTAQRRLEEQLRQAQKMEAVGRLAGGVAHDFNNMLTVIGGYCDLLEAGSSDERSARMVSEIRLAADRATGLTRQLLAFSRNQVLEMTVLDLNATVEKIMTMLERLIGEDIHVVARLEPHLGHTRADKGQVEQVLMNLAVNARDAMPEGGKLTIETRNAELDEGYAREHSEVVPGPYVLLAVSDTGAGMDSETKARIFEPFFTTKEVGKGTGLGLATVYGVVRQSGGHVWVYSERGEGTTFKIYLPRVAEAVAPMRPSRQSMPVVSGGGESILLVEDDPLLRKLARVVLEGHGYLVGAPDTPEEALATVRSGENVDLILTDVVLPQMRGPEFVKRARESRPGLRVLFMSGYSDEAITRHGVLEDDADFIPKPFTPKALLQAVKAALSRAA